MFASEIMTAPAPTVNIDAQIADVVTKMVEQNVSGLAVLGKNQRLAGIITEGDLLRRVEIDTCGQEQASWLSKFLGGDHLAANYVRTRSRRVEDLMTTKVISAPERTPLDEIAELMQRNHIKQVPITRRGQVVGMVTRAGLVRLLEKELQQEAPVAGSDRQILERLKAELHGQDWFPQDGIEIAVEDGVVTFNGSIVDDRIRAALRVAAENVTGVKSVEDNLLWLYSVRAGLPPSF